MKKSLKLTGIMIIAAVLFAASSGFAQMDITGAIKGYVMENMENLTEWMPIPQAEVVCQLRDGDILVNTDDSGFFTIENIPPGRYALKISKQGFKAQSTKIIIQKNRTTEITINLKPVETEKIGALEGMIFEEDSAGEQKPVSGVSLTITPISKNAFAKFMKNGRVLFSKEERSLIQRTKTDEEGYYKFDNLEAGDYLFSASKTGYRSIHEKVTVIAGETGVSDLAIHAKYFLKPTEGEDDTPAISGHVYRLNNEEKEVVSGVTVFVSPYFPYPTFAPLPVYKAVSNEDGFYAFFDLCPGEYNIFVETESYQRWEERIILVSEKPVSKDVLLTPTTTLSTLKGHVYDGSVICEDSENCISAILPGAEVTLYLNIPDSDETIPPKEYHAVTDKSGIYYFTDIPAEGFEYSLDVNAEGYQAWKEMITIEPGDNVHEVYLKPVPTCTESSECGADMYCAKATGDCTGKGVCAPKPEACPEVYLPVCGCDGKTYGNKCEAATGGISVGYEGECLSPEETGAISGKVTDSSDESKLIANADIFLFEPSPISSVLPDSFSTRTDENGFYQIANIPPATYAMTVNADGYQKWEEKIVIEKGETLLNDVKLKVMNEVSVLKGNVYDGSVKCGEGEKCILPIAGAKITVFPTDSGVENSLASERHAVADENGFYEFPDLPAGEYKCNMIVKAEGYNIWEEIIKIAPGENILNVSLTPTVTCVANSECGAYSYCAKAIGVCEEESGLCAPIPDMCIALYDPVCGCDGKTYGNDCEAAVAGVNVAYKGECSL